MTPTIWVVLVPLVMVVAADVWVYTDARSRQGTGREPGLQVGSVQVDTPETWTLACVVLFVIAFPLYLIARKEAG